jgi:2-oxoglutarate ferredoxin oxidoreductase subunit alpha
LPTRTEQGDLNLAIYAGHGDFPRIILAPGNIEDGIELTQKAFNLADKYNVPVIILTDQYYLDSYQNSKKVDFSKFENQYAFIKTKKDYKTYEYAKDGISKRGVPGHGSGFVCVDSDEHDEYGRITEDFETRVKMVDKRFQKGETLKQDTIEPEIIGPKNYKKLVIGWGSTYGAITEALARLDDKDIAFAYFRQVFPLPEKTKKLLEKAEKTYLVENNATGQFGDLIKLNTGIEIDQRILQYNGLPFSTETIIKNLEEK